MTVIVRKYINIPQTIVLKLKIEQENFQEESLTFALEMSVGM